MMKRKEYTCSCSNPKDDTTIKLWIDENIEPYQQKKGKIMLALSIKMGICKHCILQFVKKYHD